MLNVANGMLDLNTGELHPHDPKFLATKMMGCSYDPDADCPQWMAYLDKVLPDPDLREYVQKMVGYTLTGNPVQRAVAILYGPGGTGKSRFIEILAAVFGEYGTTAADSLLRSKREQTGPSNDLHDLRGARLASVSELDSGVRMDEALVKRLSGLDRITSRDLYESNQTWTPECVIWLATNHLPKISSDDGAIWDRMKVIPFKQQITSAERDPFILTKLMGEASGILNWILQGLALYNETQDLATPQSVLAEVAEYRNDQDSVVQFFGDSIEEGRLVVGDPEDLSILKSQLFVIYKEWCRNNFIQALGQVRFSDRVRTMGYEQIKRSRWFWRGISPGSLGVLGTFG
jgi:putative DNA primase/helicase